MDGLRQSECRRKNFASDPIRKKDIEGGSMSPDEEPRPRKEDQKKTRFILIFNPYPSISKQKEMRKNHKQ